ncbi:MAG: DPP IV N-terminal domain-containing protein [Sandaracinaceae bacterium]
MRTSSVTIGLLALLPLASCDSSESASNDDPTTGDTDGEQEGPMLAPAAQADADFLDAYAETDRFRNGHPRSIEILPDASGVLFLRSESRSHEGRMYFFDVQSRQERELLTAAMLLGDEEEELTAEERARRERMRLTARGLSSFRVSPDGATLLIPLSGRLFLVDRAALPERSAIRELESQAGPATDPRFSPDGTHIATVRDGDLYVIDVATGAERRLTTKASDAIENGLAEFVAQEEMDRMRGYWWSPDSGSIVYQTTDHTGMERMHILDPAHPENEPTSWPYPRPGAQNARVTLGIISIAGGPTRAIEWDHEAYPYLASVNWSAYSPLTVLAQDRLQEHEVLLRVDPLTGQTQTILEEEDAAWINLDQTVPRWVDTPDGELLFSTERDGSSRLEVRAADGSHARWLTPEGLEYRGLAAVDRTAGVAWIMAGDDPTSTHVYKVRIDGEGEPERVSDGDGEHSVVVSRDGTLYVLTSQSGDGTTASVVRRTDGADALGTLSSGAEALPGTPSLTFETVGRREWRAVIARPREYDASLRYPVIVYVYGGPHVRNVTHTPVRYLLSQWQADHNYIVVTIDGRGTPGRGREWERAIDGDFISAPLEDQVEALQQLGDAHPEMDMDRVGIWGWSFGGYFSAMAALRRPDVFRAAVAGAPVSEWRDYDTHYTERYLGLPEDEGTEGAYQRSSVLTFAAAPIGAEEEPCPLLMIHGTADDNVYFSHSLKLQNALFRAGRPGDLLALSGLTHMVPEATVMRRMHGRIMAFFEEHLRGE